jgi:hypothetical protein
MNSAQGTFISVMGVIVMFNFLFWIIGLLPSFLSYASLITAFVTIAIAVLVISLIPFINGGTFQITWASKVALLVGLLFGINLNILGLFNFQIGLGLATNLIGLGNPDPNTLMSIPFYFFLVLGITGTYTGYLSMTGA